MTRIMSLALLLTVSIFTFVRGADVKTLDIGASAPDFDLPGIDGKQHTLKEYAGAKILCIIFTANRCPTAQAYESRIKQMYADYKDKGVALVAINPNDPKALTLDELRYSDLNDSLPDMKIRAREKGFEFPYLYDGDKQEAAHAFGCQATPHAFIFDADRKLCYEGGIDDSEVKQVHHTYARDAIDALLAGKEVPVAKTHVFGCSTKWAEKEKNAEKAIEQWDQEPVTIAPIDVAGVKKLATNDSKKLRLINCWATWCAPCEAELPDLLTINRIYRGRDVEVITINTDDPKKQDAPITFLKEKHLALQNYYFNSDDKDAMVSALSPTWEGPVPYTVLLAPGGKVLYKRTGPFDVLELRRAIVDYLGRTY